MRTAILISGHLRDYETNLDHLMYLKQKLNADVFVSTYRNAATGVRFWQSQESTDGDLSREELQPLYTLEPVKIDFDVPMLPDDFPVTAKFKNTAVSVENVYKMFYKMWLCNQHKLEHENSLGMKYDWVMRFRFDTKIAQLDITDITTLMCARADLRQFVTDSFFAGPSAVIDTVHDVVSYFTNTSVKQLSNYENAEDVLTKWISLNNLQYQLGNSVVTLRDKVFN